jgi:DNA-binding transcriptional MerR regulator
VGDVVVALGISSSTVRNWTELDVIQKHLSDQATRRGDFTHAKQREYTESDLYILNTLRTQKTRLNSWEDVASILQDGYLDRDLPASSALVLPETKAETFQLLTIARTEIENLRKQVEKLEDELTTEREERRQDVERLSQQKVDDVAQLHHTIGRLEILLEQAGIDPKTGKPQE